MHVYKLQADTEFASLYVPSAEEGMFLVDVFDGTPLATRWPSIRVEILREDHEPKDRYPLGDIAFLRSGAPAFSPRALALLMPLLTQSGELLPLWPLDGALRGWQVLNITQVCRVLDLERSDVQWLEDGKRAMNIAKFEFHLERLDAVLFKIPELVRSNVFVLDEFRGVVETAGLKGFEFVEIWPEDHRRWKLSSRPQERQERIVPTGERPLHAEEMSEVVEAANAGSDLLGAITGKEQAAETIERIYGKIDELRRHDEAVPTDVTVALGCFWGQILVRECGWSWAIAKREGEEYLAIVSPERSHLILPVHLFQRYLAEPERDNTALLVFNMVRARILPKSSPGSYQVLW